MAWSTFILKLEVAAEFRALSPDPYADMMAWAWAARSYDRARKVAAYRANREYELRRVAEIDRRRRAEQGDHVCALQRDRAHRWYLAAKGDPEKMHKIRERRRRTKIAHRVRLLWARGLECRGQCPAAWPDDSSKWCETCRTAVAA